MRRRSRRRTGREENVVHVHVDEDEQRGKGGRKEDLMRGIFFRKKM